MRRKNLILNFFIVIICLAVIGISVFNIFLYTVGRSILQEKLSVILKRKAEIGSVSYFTLKGIIIRDLVIWNAENEHPLYHFKELRIRPSIYALIFQKKLKFRSELSPTKNFKAKIDAVGNYNFKASELFLKFKLKDVPYIEDLGTLYGTLRLYKKPDLKEGENPTDMLEITFTSPKILLTAKSSIVNNNGKTEIQGKILAPFIKTSKFQFNNINSDLTLIGDKLYIYNLYSDFYRGVFRMDGYMDLDNPIPPFSISATVKDMDIYEFSTTSSFAKREVSGTCNGTMKLKGILGVTNSLYGKSRVEIKNANLWETGTFKGLATLLFIPNLNKVIFTDAYGNFQIKNSQFYTDNFKLVSKELELSLKGSLGFDDKVDAVVRIRFKKELIQDSEGLSKISSILLESAGWFAGNVKITGYSRDPAFNVNPIGVGNILDKVKKSINKVKDILK